MDMLIAAVLIVGVMVLVEVRAHKHDKPVKENLQAVRNLNAIAKPLPRRGDQNV
jgi:hypothetical protein